MRPVIRRLLAVLGVCLVFALGVATGAVVTLRIVRHRAESLLTRRGSDLATERLARVLSGRLHCDSAQSGHIAEILRSARGELWEVRREAAPRVRDILQRVVERIRGTLRPDQAKAFDEIVARQTAHLHLDDEPATPGPTASVTPVPPTP